MRKLKKQVTRLKISHFLEKNLTGIRPKKSKAPISVQTFCHASPKLILFYQSSLIVEKQQNTTNRDKVLLPGSALKKAEHRSNSLNGLKDKQSEILALIKNEEIYCYQANVLFVKNKIAQKALHLYLANLNKIGTEHPSRQSTERLPTFSKYVKVDKRREEDLSATKRSTDRENRQKNISNDLLPVLGLSNTLVLKNTNSGTYGNAPGVKVVLGGTAQPSTAKLQISEADFSEESDIVTAVIANQISFACTPLLQGNTILLGCTHLNKLHHILKKYNQPMGALYGTCVLDRSQVKRLAKFGQNEESHQKIISCIKSPAIEILFFIKNRLSILSLSVKQTQLLKLLQIRNNYISSV